MKPGAGAEPLPLDDEGDDITELVRDVRVFMAERGWHLDTAAITSEGLVLRIHSLPGP
jgi:hypothetical protein